MWWRKKNNPSQEELKLLRDALEARCWRLHADTGRALSIQWSGTSVCDCLLEEAKACDALADFLSDPTPTLEQR